MSYRVPQRTLEHFKELVERGLSQRQIGKEMNVSKSTVAGWVARHGKAMGVKLKRAKGDGSGCKTKTALPDTMKRLDRNKLVNIALAHQQPELVEPLHEHACDFWALDDTRCHYPYGNRPPYRFCCASKKPSADIPYCAFHARLCGGAYKT